MFVMKLILDIKKQKLSYRIYYKEKEKKIRPLNVRPNL